MNARCLTGSLLLLCLSLISLTTALPLSSNTRARRSNEVIFYENQQKAVGLNKRSESWPIIHENAEPKTSEDVKSPAADDTPADLTDLLTEQAVEEVEEKAFYEALEFLVDQLAVEGGLPYYDDEEYITDEFPDSDDMTSLEVYKPEAETSSKDAEAEQLTSLIQFAHNAEASEKQEVSQRSDNSPIIPPLTDNSKDEAVEEVEKEEEREFGTTTTAPLDVEDYENFGLTTGGYDYDISNLLDYLDYLDMLKKVEGKLKSELQRDNQKLGQTELSEVTKSRKKRSLETSLKMMDEGEYPSDYQPADDTPLYGSPTAAAKGGLCFTADEVAELKALLVQLAKEKIEAEDLISYLLGTEDIEDLYEDDEYERDGGYGEDSREWGYGAGKGYGDGGNRYGGSNSRTSLYKLGQRMNEPNKRAPTYWNDWPYERK